MRVYYLLKRKVKGTLEKKLNIRLNYGSETQKIRHLVLPFCEGYGCDVGFGGDKIKKEECDGIDYPRPYTQVGRDSVDIGVDVINEEIPVSDNTYDYVYTSHLIEDFTDTTAGLRKLIRILKNGGTLILAFPDQGVYEDYCYQRAIPLNPFHKHAKMGLEYMMACLNEVNNAEFEILFQSNCEIDYNVILVLRVIKLNRL